MIWFNGQVKSDKKIFGVATAIIAGMIVIISLIIYFSAGKEIAGASIFYYSITCPHCKTVEDYMARNGTEEKDKIVKKEVSLSKKNAQEFLARMVECGYKIEEAGVPMLWTEGKCIVGDQPIIDHFEQIDEDK